MHSARVCAALLWAVFAFSLLCAAVPFSAIAQHNHDAGHGEYQNWSSRKTANCCNNEDCGGLKETELRETETGPQVLIDGQWCAVLDWHYLTRGKSPDWSVAHACIRKGVGGCDRLLCYSPKGGF